MDLLTQLHSDVLTLTNRMVFTLHDEGWWIVASEEDWITRVFDQAITEIFTHIIAFPEAGVNSIHSEILLTAFAEDVFTATPSDQIVIKGAIESNDPLWRLIQRFFQWERLVAFRMNGDKP